MLSKMNVQDRYSDDEEREDGESSIRFRKRDNDAEQTRDYEHPSWLDVLTDYYVAVCFDREDDPEIFDYVRRPNMIPHVAWARRSTRIEDCRARVMFSRPMLNDELSKTIGSLIGIAAVSREDAEALLDSEPYLRAGLFGNNWALYSWPMNDHIELTYELRPFPHAVVTRHNDGIAARRAEVRQSHLDYLISLGNVAGAAPLIPLYPAAPGSRPVTDGSDRGPAVGSLIFLNAATVEDAEALMALDPYNQTGIVQSTKVYRIN